MVFQGLLADFNCGGPGAAARPVCCARFTEVLLERVPMSAAAEYRYNRLTWPEMNDAIASQKLVILPTGSTEQHGPHLPLDVDLFLCESVCLEVGGFGQYCVGRRCDMGWWCGRSVPGAELRDPLL